VVNNFLLTVAAASILLGTLYPLFIDVLELGKVSVGAPYFESVFVPMMIPMVAIMGVAPLLKWKRGDYKTALEKLRIAVILSIIGGLGVWILIDHASALAALGMTISLWLFIATFTELAVRIKLFESPLKKSFHNLCHQPRASWGMTLAHAGLAVAIAGMTASSAWKVENIQVMNFGETIDVAGYTYTLKEVKEVKGPNYTALRGTFIVKKGNDISWILKPEKRFYTDPVMVTTEAAIRPTFLGDLYAVIGDREEKSGGYVTRIYFNPLVPWMWVGAIFMVLGAAISLTDRRHRVGAPANNKVAIKGLPAE
jgi:cytochrome c-type biogenesis protein CcmF